jgi:hypothetical protein
VEELIPRVAASLPTIAVGIDHDQGRELLPQISRADYAISQLAGQELIHLWQEGLHATTSNQGVSPSVDGLALRLLYDQRQIDEVHTSRHFHHALSAANGPLNIAEWIGGFLYGSSQLLLHFPPLWKMLDNWVEGLSWSDFELALPLLRRTLTDFTPAEKREIFALAAKRKDAAGVEQVGSQAEPTEGHPIPESPELLDALRSWLG